MKLSALLTADRIVLDIKERDKNALLSKLIKTLAERGGVNDVAMLEKEVKEREDLGNTGIGRGIGFPHSKSSQVSNILALLARPAKPVEYGSIDNVPVSIILLIVAPADGDNNEYLHTMARISRLLGKSDVREQILKAHSPEEVMQIIIKHE
jgi:mannitol/fructose-specific phosphotransferase system IIA component (Ntr-type)